MSKHDHVKECAHEVKVCADCDVAYCKKCEKEWGAPCTLNHYSWYYTTPNTWPTTSPITSPWGTTITTTTEPHIYTSSAGHAHN